MMTDTWNRVPVNVTTRLHRPKIRRAWSAPSHRLPPPTHPLTVSGFRLHRDVESEFQSELGKCLFDKTVEVHETTKLELIVTSAPTRDHTTDSNDGGPSPSRSFCCAQQCDQSPHLRDRRRCVNIRKTQCKSPLVTDGRNFMSYFNRGQLDTVSIAKTRGVVDFPAPNIGKCVRQVRGAKIDALGSLSLKEGYFDDSVEGLRDRYWRDKIVEVEETKRLKAVEVSCEEILEELIAGPVSDQIFFMERRRHLLWMKESLDKQTEDWFDSIREEVKKEAEEREAARKLTEAQAKKSKRKKSRGKRPRSILKNRPSSGAKSDTESDGASLKSSKTGSKSVSFRDNLTETRIIRPKSSGKKKKPQKQTHVGGAGDNSGAADLTSKKGRTKSQEGRVLSPKKGKSGKKSKTFPGCSSNEKVLKTKRRGNAVKPSSDGPVASEISMEIVDENKLEPVPEPRDNGDGNNNSLVQEPDVTIVEGPPEFSPAEEYLTKNEMVADWLQNRYCSAAPKTLPLL